MRLTIDNLLKFEKLKSTHLAIGVSISIKKNKPVLSFFKRLPDGLIAGEVDKIFKEIIPSFSIARNTILSDMSMPFVCEAVKKLDEITNKKTTVPAKDARYQLGITISNANCYTMNISLLNRSDDEIDKLITKMNCFSTLFFVTLSKISHTNKIIDFIITPSGEVKFILLEKMKNLELIPPGFILKKNKINASRYSYQLNKFLSESSSISYSNEQQSKSDFQLPGMYANDNSLQQHRQRRNNQQFPQRNPFSSSFFYSQKNKQPPPRQYKPVALILLQEISPEKNQVKESCYPVNNNFSPKNLSANPFNCRTSNTVLQSNQALQDSNNQPVSFLPVSQARGLLTSLNHNHNCIHNHNHHFNHNQNHNHNCTHNQNHNHNQNNDLLNNHSLQEHLYGDQRRPLSINQNRFLNKRTIPELERDNSDGNRPAKKRKLSPEDIENKIYSEFCI